MPDVRYLHEEREILDKSRTMKDIYFIQTSSEDSEEYFPINASELPPPDFSSQNSNLDGYERENDRDSVVVKRVFELQKQN